jgi:hypothetical protein
MREKYLQEDSDERANSIDNNYLWQEDLNTDRYPNLSLSKFDNPGYLAILKGNFGKVPDGQLKEGFQYFADKLDPLSIEEIDNLRKRLLRSITVVSIRTDGEQSAFRLFETLNDRGLELSAVDLMKNHLFSSAATSADIDYNQVQKDWEQIVELIVPNTSKPSRFFRHYIMSCSSPSYEGSVSDYKLYDVFRQVLSSEIPGLNISVNEYIADMAQKASLYIDIINHSVDKYDAPGNKAINDRLDELELLNLVQARTILLRILSEFSSANRVIEAFGVLEPFLIRWKTANYATGGELDRLYSRICSQAFDDGEATSNIRDILADRCPSDAEFRSGLRNRRVRLNDRTKYMLKRIEEEYYNGAEVDLSDTDIEHIAPRASFSAKKYSAWPAKLDMTEGEFEQIRDVLGNLTLLEKNKNMAVGANPFDSKRSVYSGSKYEMTKAISRDYSDWSEAEILARSEELAQVATKIWSL